MAALPADAEPCARHEQWEKLQEIPAAESHAARRGAKAVSGQVHENGTAPVADARPVVVAENEDEVVKSVVAP